MKTRYTGKTIAEAVAIGLQALNKQPEQVEYQVIVTPKKGFLGIGRRDAVITMTVKEEPAPTPTQAAKSEATPAPDPAKVETPEAGPTQASVEPSVSSARQQRDQAFRELGYYLADITKQMGITTTINVTPGSHVVRYDFTTPTEGLLIGKHGKVINSLQLLAQVFLDKHLRHHVRVELNVADYRQRRAETLERLAKRVARNAIAQGESQYLDPMPSFERKVIHGALAHNDHVKTYSRGREPYRSVVVEPVHR